MHDENGTLTNVILRTVFAGFNPWCFKMVVTHVLNASCIAMYCLCRPKPDVPNADYIHI